MLKVPSYLLHKDPMALPAHTNHPRMKCENTQINNSFETILDEDWPCSIVVKNINAEETMDMFKAFAMHLCFFIYLMFNLDYPKELEAKFFY